MSSFSPLNTTTRSLLRPQIDGFVSSKLKILLMHHEREIVAEGEKVLKTTTPEDGSSLGLANSVRDTEEITKRSEKGT
jgi:hypothetical protein